MGGVQLTHLAELANNRTLPIRTLRAAKWDNDVTLTELHAIFTACPNLQSFEFCGVEAFLWRNLENLPTKPKLRDIVIKSYLSPEGHQDGKLTLEQFGTDELEVLQIEYVSRLSSKVISFICTCKLLKVLVIDVSRATRQFISILQNCHQLSDLSLLGLNPRRISDVDLVEILWHGSEHLKKLRVHQAFNVSYTFAVILEQCAFLEVVDFREWWMVDFCTIALQDCCSSDSSTNRWR